MNCQIVLHDLKWSRFTVKTLICVVAGLMVSGANSEEMPGDSKLLIERLEEFEAEELKKFETIVADKRAQVAKVLEQHLSRETKKGNLDGALALKEKIAGLSKAVSPSSEKAKEEAMAPATEPNPEQADAEFVGTSWKADNSKFSTQTLHLFADGKGEGVDKSGAKTPRTYKVIENGNGKELVEVVNGDQKYLLTVIREEEGVVALQLGKLGSFVRLSE